MFKLIKSRMVFVTIVVTVVSLLLTACVSTTPYRPANGDDYGYTSQKIDDDSYRVSFVGNSRTDKETVRNYLLFRAAEITLEEGGDYFVIASQNTESDIQQTSSITGSPFFNNGFRFGRGFGGTATAHTTNTIAEYEAYASIRIRQGQKPVDNALAYNARQVIDNLRSQIDRSD